jgi:hypothetical protein
LHQLLPAVSGHSSAVQCSGSLEIPTTNAYRSCPLCWLARNESNTISVVISDYRFSFVRISRKKKTRLKMDLSGNSVLGVRRRSTSPSELKPPFLGIRDKAKKKSYSAAVNRK